MAVGIVALALAVPQGPHGLLGPDEDPFTVAAEAVESVEEASTNGPDGEQVGRVWLLGDLPQDAGWMIPELIGRPSVPVVRKGSSREDLWATIQSIAGHAAEEGDDLVVVTSAEGELPPGEVAGCAIRLRSGAGLEIHSMGTVSPPRTHGIDVATAIAIEYRNVGKARGSMPPVVALDELRPRGAIPAPGSRALSGLASWVKGQSPGALAVLVDQDPREAAYFTEVELRSPVRVSGPWTERRPPSEEAHPPAAARDPALLLRVSEGAYVPWPTYRESLASRWRFEGESCSHCGEAIFPMRGRCPKCGATDGLVRRRMPRHDLEVCASTVIHPGAQPTEFDPQVSASGPYSVVLAELAPGVRATLQVADSGLSGPVPVGTRVDTRIRRLYPMEGRWRYGRKATRKV